MATYRLFQQHNPREGRNTTNLVLSTLLLIVLIATFSCQTDRGNTSTSDKEFAALDTVFTQEIHESFPLLADETNNCFKSIAIDQNQIIWIAGPSGVFFMPRGTKTWRNLFPVNEQGPAYAVHTAPNGSILIGKWDGLYREKNNKLTKQNGPVGPISVICSDREKSYAIGPFGIWIRKGESWEKIDPKVARSVTDAAIDKNGNLWITTSAGLYSVNGDKTNLFQDTTQLISAYASAIDFSQKDECWVGSMGGIAIRKNDKTIQNIRTQDGLPSISINCIKKAPDGTMWVGTNAGLVRFYPNKKPSLLFSKRWLPDDHVNAITFEPDGNAWIATDEGICLIRQQRMTLEEKQENFYQQLMHHNIRAPWICGAAYLPNAGDTSSYTPRDDDNDGEFTSGYLAMESFRDAVTHSEDAYLKARKAFNFLTQLQSVTGTEGFIARSIIPADQSPVHDPNRTYSAEESADAIVNDPRFKPVEKSWHLSSDGKWLWKGDTSSDEMDGHFMGYFYFYQLAARELDKKQIRNHVSQLVNTLIKNNYNLIDVDGKHTRWGVWSPDQLNRDPDWSSERSINSFELLTYLKFAYGITENPHYQQEYLRLIEQEGYLQNAQGINTKNPAWQIYFDRTMEGYLFPIILTYENDPELRTVYLNMLDKWMKKQTSGENLINNLAYTFCTGTKINTKETVDFLCETPLDLIDWEIDHSKREDIQLVHSPVLEEEQINQLPPPIIRATVRWDRNPWAAKQGNSHILREPIFWLWPYWESRYLGILKASVH